MAKKLSVHCNVDGCPEIVESGRCEKHSKSQGREHRFRRHNEPFYNTNRWQKLRKVYRKKNPLCERCKEKGLTVPADMVHHIIPISKGGSKTDWKNLEALCDTCHGKEHDRK